MKDFLNEKFPEILLAVLALSFAGVSMWLYHKGDSGEGFRWASGTVTTLVGGLLMKMQIGRGNGSGNPPAPPNASK